MEGIVSDEEWEILDRKELGSIWLCLVPSLKFNITKVKMIEELMETLAKLYENPSASNKVFLMKWLFNMKMVQCGSITDHLNEFNVVTYQLSSVVLILMKKLGLSWFCVLFMKAEMD